MAVSWQSLNHSNVERITVSPQKFLLFSNDFIVQRFFSYPEHCLLLSLFLNGQSLKYWKQLENAFCDFYFEVRFTKYLSSTIKYAFIDYQRKKERREERNPVIFDMELNEENNQSFGEKYSPQSINDEVNASPNPEDLLDSISDESVFNSFSDLTITQKKILTYTYSMSYLDKEISRILSISPQAVSKSRNTALEKIRRRMSIIYPELFIEGRKIK
ncbi:sigma-70 family RNA polymerase sigma factor [Paenibacillus sp. N3/727]|uniref:sigma-70 family RNA polymerase sigma factor n=1 Tax=Paenibacillus sp. N3/727 TaxID=2925845 RepID=UPI001F53A5F3|nr:sigma-70 family RNA polymerase sigma factor [Paenibacillus sp. N3/727]UNK17131.1 sigma-70 family RNA polymerase sigma factor [Paenibacillus sp. N3/727]